MNYAHKQLRTRTIKLAQRIIDAAKDDRQEWDSTLMEEIIKQNEVLYSVLQSIKGSPAPLDEIPPPPSADHLMNMAKIIRIQYTENSGKNPTFSVVQAIYDICLSQLDPERNKEKLASAMLILIDNSGATPDQVKHWIQSSKRICNI